MFAIKNFNTLFIGGLLLLIAGWVQATEQDADSIRHLAGMVKAMHSLNYQGTVVLYKNGELDTIKFSHIVNAQGEAQEHVVALNSPLRKVIRNTEKVLCIYPEVRTMVVDHLPLHRSFLMDFPANPEVLKANYTLMRTGEETIALQPAVIVTIKPKDDYRYARRIWIGKENHLPLKYEMFNSDEKVLEQITFTDLMVNSALAAGFAELDSYQEDPELSVQHIHQLQPLPVNQAGFTLQNLPNGFKQVFFYSPQNA